MPPRIDGMARRHLRDPVRIHMGSHQTDAGQAPLVRQVAYVVPRAYKAATLGRVLDVESPVAAIVFCRTRDEVDQITETLNERATKQRITIEKVPTTADLPARRLELTRAVIEESMLQDDLEHFRVVVETLADEYDVMEVAMAAVKLAHEAGGAAADEEEIPEITPVTGRDGRARKGPGGRPPRGPGQASGARK